MNKASKELMIGLVGAGALLAGSIPAFAGGPLSLATAGKSMRARRSVPKVEPSAAMPMYLTVSAGKGTQVMMLNLDRAIREATAAQGQLAQMQGKLSTVSAPTSAPTKPALRLDSENEHYSYTDSPSQRGEEYVRCPYGPGSGWYPKRDSRYYK